MSAPPMERIRCARVVRYAVDWVGERDERVVTGADADADRA
jgi:hypothetical protein